MNKAKHTPGPWALFDRGDGETYSRFRVEYKTGAIRSVLADINPWWVCEEHGSAESNACLIAAAPDLLSALDELLATHELREYKGERITPMESNAMEQARAAISKARGN